MSRRDWKQSQYYQEDFLASHSVLPGSEEARGMTVTSGQRCSELYRRSDPVGSLVRMLLESSVWRSTRCYLTWKTSATPARRLLFRLVPSMPRTEEIGAPFWPTPTTQETEHPDMVLKNGRREAKNGNTHSVGLADAVRMWPTPSATDCGRTKINPVTTKNGTIRHRNKTGGQSYARLDAVAAMFPTPTARDCKGANSVEHLATGNHVDQLCNMVRLYPAPTAHCAQTPCVHGEGAPDLATRVGGQLNPTWVEWLMGFPIGWTDLGASETQSCPGSSAPSSRV